MIFGMTKEQFEILNQLVIRPLKMYGAEVFVFGSRTTEKFHPHSDVDLLYRMPAGKNLPAAILSEMKESIEESLFPFAVDLVEEKDLAEGYRTSVLSQIKAI